jgi:hypothetical protein
MTLISDRYSGCPPTSLRQVFPNASFGWFRGIIAPTITVHISEGDGVGGGAAAQVRWLVGFNSIVDIFAWPNPTGMTSTTGATLNIWGSVGGIGLSLLDSILLTPVGAGGQVLYTVITGYVLPAWEAAFDVYNPGPGNYSVWVLIKVRSV